MHAWGKTITVNEDKADRSNISGIIDPDNAALTTSWCVGVADDMSKIEKLTLLTATSCLVMNGAGFNNDIRNNVKQFNFD